MVNQRLHVFTLRSLPSSLSKIHSLSLISQPVLYSPGCRELKFSETGLPVLGVLGNRVARGSHFGKCPDGQRKRTPAVGSSEVPTAGVPGFCRERVTGVQAV